MRTIESAAEATLTAQLDSDEVPIDPMRLCREIADFIATDDEMIVIGDGGDIVAQASKVLKVPEHGTWMDPGPLGTLGVGMPFALAAQLTHPGKRVLIIYGDGSFGLNGFEYDTAVRFGLPIVGIVGNDAAWGQMMRPQAMIYGAERLVATELTSHALRPRRRSARWARRTCDPARRHLPGARAGVRVRQAGAGERRDAQGRRRDEGLDVRLTPRTPSAGCPIVDRSTCFVVG